MTKKTFTPIVVAYVRYSSEKQSMNSLEDQLRKCREIAAHHGWEISDENVYSDAAITGTEAGTAKRAGYQALLKAWDENRFQILIVEDFSRLSRDGVEQAKIQRRIENNRSVRLLTVDSIDTQDHDWQLRMGFQGLIAQQDVRKLGARVVRGMMGQLDRGYMIATPAFGYQRRTSVDGRGNGLGTIWVIDEAQSSIVREIFTMRENGSSMHQISAWLNSAGVPTQRKARTEDGGFWRPSRIRNLLSNAIYRGEFVWHGSTTHLNRVKKMNGTTDPVYYPRSELRLVSDETWYRCNTKTISRTGYGGGKHHLTGLVTCGACKGTLALTAATKLSRRSLVCSHCTVKKYVTESQTPRMTGSVSVIGMNILLRAALKLFLTPAFINAFKNSMHLRLAGNDDAEILACQKRSKQLYIARERYAKMLGEISDEDLTLERNYHLKADEFRKNEEKLKQLEMGKIKIDAKVAQDQLRADPVKLVDSIFDENVPPARLRALLTRLFPVLILERKASKYESHFRIAFSPGTALAEASDTGCIDETRQERGFVLKYSPNHRNGEGYWSVRMTE